MFLNIGSWLVENYQGLGTFLICLLITVSLHELAHLLVALRCGIGVKAFSIGFGKPYLHKTIKGIDYRLSPVLLGGYCNLKGMNTRKDKDDFLAHRYAHKFAVLVAGVTVNILLALGIYMVHYGSVSLGLKIDWIMLKAMFTQDYTVVEGIFRYIPINIFLLQLSILNLFCGLSNLIPIVPLDGGLIWYYMIEKKLSKGFKKFIHVSGWIFVMGIQIFVIYWIYFK
jgi:membrane-associated protease RseP (regulator of RpoE activity)